MNRAALAAAIAGLTLLWWPLDGLCEDDAAEWPFLDVRVPLELYDDGSVKTEIRADAAGSPHDGVTRARGVVVFMFSPHGVQEARFEAEQCRFDRGRGIVESDGPVRLESGNVTVEGVGMVWKAEEQEVRILKNVRVTFTGSPLVDLEEGA